MVGTSPWQGSLIQAALWPLHDFSYFHRLDPTGGGGGGGQSQYLATDNSGYIDMAPINEYEAPKLIPLVPNK